MIFPFLESFIYFVNCIVKTVENIRRIFLILVSHFSKSNVIAALDSGRCFVKWYEILLIGPGRNKNWKKNDVCLEFELSQNVLFLYQHKLILYQCLLYWWTISLCRFHFLSFLLTRNYPFPPCCHVSLAPTLGAQQSGIEIGRQPNLRAAKGD